MGKGDPSENEKDARQLISKKTILKKLESGKNVGECYSNNNVHKLMANNYFKKNGVSHLKNLNSRYSENNMQNGHNENDHNENDHNENDHNENDHNENDHNKNDHNENDHNKNDHNENNVNKDNINEKNINEKNINEKNINEDSNVNNKDISMYHMNFINRYSTSCDKEDYKKNLYRLKRDRNTFETLFGGESTLESFANKNKINRTSKKYRNYNVIKCISRQLNYYVNKGPSNESVKILIEQVSYISFFTLIKNILTYLPFPITNYLIGTVQLKNILNNSDNLCFKLYTKDELMKYVYKNEGNILVDNQIYILFAKYKIIKYKNELMNHSYFFNGTYTNNNNKSNKYSNNNNVNNDEHMELIKMRNILLEKTRTFMYNNYAFVEGRSKNISYIYDICHALKYKTNTFLLSVFIFDCYINRVNQITNKNHYKKIKLLVIISSILLAIIRTQTFKVGEKVPCHVQKILFYINRKKNINIRFSCIQIANKQMEMLKFLPSNYTNLLTYSELVYIYLYNLKKCSEIFPAIKIYFTFLEEFGFLYYIFDVIYTYSMYIVSVGLYSVIPPSRIAACIILYFSNAFFNRVGNINLFQEQFCEHIFHLSYTNDLLVWSYLFFNNFIYFFENCFIPNKNYVMIHSIFHGTGRMLNLYKAF
ncbi:conserved membrane protein, unknown function [Hepatocystis sp. ex Piliocolobus tephrosceles]|nr:conserved membrane protein, unknown function [Hepatocystis sp. ex Piliocolobus tephrosceles]